LEDIEILENAKHYALKRVDYNFNPTRSVASSAYSQGFKEAF
jgi:hypothetical protein